MPLINPLVKSGFDCYNEGCPEQAVEYFRRAIKGGDGSAEARCFLAHSLHAAGHGAQACLLMGKLIRSHPSYMPARLGLAGMKRLQGRLDEARSILEGALKLEPGNPRVRTTLWEVLRALALGALESGDLKTSEKYWSELLLGVPDDREARFQLEAIKSKRSPGALKGPSKKGPRLVSENSARRQKRFQDLLAQGEFHRAFELGERLLDEASDLRPNQAFWWPWYKRKNHRKILDRLILSKPTPWAYYYRGLLRGAEGFEPDALELSHLEKISRFEASRYGWMNIRAGQAFLLAGRSRTALRLLSSALRCKPVDWPLHGYRAEALLCQNEPARALAEMDQALEAAPKEEKGKVLGWRGELELWRGNYDEAFRLSERACAQGGVFAFCWRGASKLKQGHPREALGFLDHAIKNFPFDLESYVWRGEARRELRLFIEALEDLSRVPDFVWGRWNRALVHAEMGNEKYLRADFASLPDYAIAYVRKRVGLRGRGALSPADMKRILAAGLEMSRGFRRNGYRQAVWMVRG